VHSLIPSTYFGIDAVLTVFEEGMHLGLSQPKFLVN
jgi:hypothetical protein